MTQLDEIDWKILATLQKSANLANTDLADQVGLTPAPCLRRVKHLSQLGIIQRFSIALDNKRLGFTLSALVEVTLAQHTARAARKFISAIQGKREVIACHMVTGDCDFILRIMSRDIDAYRKVVWEDLHAIEGVLKIRSSVILETFKDQLSPTLDMTFPDR
jgi:Lrp/AsnC family transcriptional regulator, leucine-responsive regulatory protein